MEVFWKDQFMYCYNCKEDLKDGIWDQCESTGTGTSLEESSGEGVLEGIPDQYESAGTGTSLEESGR